MSSIRDSVRRLDMPGATHSLLRRLRARSIDPACKFIECSDAAREIIETALPEWTAVPCCTPPFERSWIEFTLNPSSGKPAQVAGIVEYEQIADGSFVVSAHLLILMPQTVVYAGKSQIELSPEGRIQRATTDPIRPGLSVDVVDYVHFFSRTTQVIVHVFAKLHCNNVQLRPFIAPRPSSRRRKETLRACVWHRIVVTSVPRVICSGGESERPHFRHDRPLRWIRGHYADYRRKGLFGRDYLRGLYWIPEYSVGNEEVGMVIPEYVVA